LEDRLDKVVSSFLECSRNQAIQLIKDSLVQINQKPIKKPSFKVQAGDVLEVEIREAKPQQRGSVDFDVEVIFEDEDMVVLNKPPFVVVHPAPSVKEPTLVDWLQSQGYMLPNLNGEERPGIVHRLDKETSGAMVVAKSKKAYESLASQLKDRSMGRYYIALVDMPLKESMEIDAPIARNRANRLKMGIVHGGKEAKSHFLKLISSKDEKQELIAAKLQSGRTHQIRVHLESKGRHILGDSLYGYRGEEVGRVMLHSAFLHLKHPVSSQGMVFAAKNYPDFDKILQDKYDKGLVDEKVDFSYFEREFHSVFNGMLT
jgi:23S rRNA pseudouridine1911/1915/1917 synthase